MIVAVGVDVDSSFSAFVAMSLRLGVQVEALNLRAAVRGDWRIPLPPTGPAEFSYAGHEIALDPEDAYFCRLINLCSPETSSAESKAWFALIQDLGSWLDQIPGKVVNRGLAAAHNSAKPLHEAILAGYGFHVPDSITSSNREELRSFAEQWPVVSKTISGIRAETSLATVAIIDAIFDPAAGPIHLQRVVDGDDARIHVVGDQLVAQRVAGSGGIDYRRDGRFDGLSVYDAPPEVKRAVVHATADLGLAFAGWDFRIGPQDCYWCLEVNPMPGFGPYDRLCDGAISRLLFDYLSSDMQARC